MRYRWTSESEYSIRSESPDRLTIQVAPTATWDAILAPLLHKLALAHEHTWALTFSKECLDEALALATSSGQNWYIVDVKRSMARYCFIVGNRARATEFIEEAVVLSEATFCENSISHSNVLSECAWIQFHSNRMRCVECLTEFERIQKTVYGKDDWAVKNIVGIATDVANGRCQIFAIEATEMV